jgi:SAM-dependent methyltransferase
VISDRDGHRPSVLSRGSSTATDVNVAYRLGKAAKLGLLHGRWLDCGCADGGYSLGLIEHGVDEVIGIDVEVDRVLEAASRAIDRPAHFAVSISEQLAFPDESFDGVLINEVLEHVDDERATLSEVFRILRPGGVLILIGPNRWFPFEGHGFKAGPVRLGFPTPIVPWLPSRWMLRFMFARNYWPRELQALVRDAGFVVADTTSVLPVFEVYPVLPAILINAYRRSMRFIERIPGLNKLGVSTRVIAVKARVATAPNAPGA